MLNSINEQERALIIKLLSNKITQQEFEKLYPVPITKAYVLECLNEAVELEDDDKLWPAMVLAYDGADTDFLPILEGLLVAEWHTSHENIALILQRLKSTTSVQCLFKAATMHFTYLEEDEFFDLARKCLWALGSINNEEAREMIKSLANSDNEVIREHAQEQIQRIKLY
ncbi:HEAT repeat domain-containing protein [Hymenobacter sp. H14-R3]|uniref:HEAT repeat domain-containing protein n=1 Tax=Hymenobacter sp. H14-R3 TaxID=3046308 RepID=UPI0024BB63AB|nr:HEAT repeat domain-containing protein [Hymenobacter sp. H14-R3]MDJ0368062.1 HEAT repeat domain-containing protein [Hymenobacter sp. H14-R3]